jgi:hypothetical protein
LEKLYLDDIFSDANFLDLLKSRTDNIVEAWKKVAKSILECPLPVRKIRSIFHELVSPFFFSSLLKAF